MYRKDWTTLVDIHSPIPPCSPIPRVPGGYPLPANLFTAIPLPYLFWGCGKAGKGVGNALGNPRGGTRVTSLSAAPYQGISGRGVFVRPRDGTSFPYLPAEPLTPEGFHTWLSEPNLTTAFWDNSHAEHRIYGPANIRDSLLAEPFKHAPTNLQYGGPNGIALGVGQLIKIARYMSNEEYVERPPDAVPVLVLTWMFHNMCPALYDIIDRSLTIVGQSTNDRNISNLRVPPSTDLPDLGSSFTRPFLRVELPPAVPPGGVSLVDVMNRIALLVQLGQTPETSAEADAEEESDKFEIMGEKVVKQPPKLSIASDANSPTTSERNQSAGAAGAKRVVKGTPARAPSSGSLALTSQYSPPSEAGRATKQARSSEMNIEGSDNAKDEAEADDDAEPTQPSPTGTAFGEQASPTISDSASVTESSLAARKTKPAVKAAAAAARKSKPTPAAASTTNAASKGKKRSNSVSAPTPAARSAGSKAYFELTNEMYRSTAGGHGSADDTDDSSQVRRTRSQSMKPNPKGVQGL
ncbi:hypothetical protein RhiJN_15039 [Ceratobasidium sp. AG-Ba]|nr:hypothetical protein RhiJN_15039 [Ceratobasidium sp. AG-Ba]